MTADSPKPPLKVILCSPRGFCAGVVRAIDTVERALAMYGKPVYVRHEIVHNRYVVDSLRQKGAVFVEELDEIPDTTAPVVIMALQKQTGTTRSIGRSRAAPRRVAVRPKDCRGSPFSTVKAVRTPNPTALVGHASRRSTWRSSWLKKS